MFKLVMGLGGAALAALATVLAVALAGGSNTAATVGTLPPPAAEISGPCDEAEHAADPRCTGAAVADRRDDDEVDDRAVDRREAGEDLRGPCDEAEHAGDPRCAGAATAPQPDIAGEDDDRGPDDRGNDDHGDHDDRSGHGGGGGDDDRSGSNSGRG
jgi:hypothetical protein